MEDTEQIIPWAHPPAPTSPHASLASLPATDPAAVAESETRTARPARTLTSLFLQAAHRLGSTGLFVLLAAITLTILKKDARILSAIALICAALGLASGTLGRALVHWNDGTVDEARGVIVFNALILEPAALLLLLSRLGLFNS